jgi:hypothetical protein
MPLGREMETSGDSPWRALGSALARRSLAIWESSLNGAISCA